MFDYHFLVGYYMTIVTANQLVIKMATRMTATSKAAIQSAARVEVFAIQGQANIAGDPLACRSYGVKAWLPDGRLCLVHGGDGMAMLYPSVGAAERAVLRLRPDVSISVCADPARV